MIARVIQVGLITLMVCAFLGCSKNDHYDENRPESSPCYVIRQQLMEAGLPSIENTQTNVIHRARLLEEYESYNCHNND